MHLDMLTTTEAPAAPAEEADATPAAPQAAPAHKQLMSIQIVK